MLSTTAFEATISNPRHRTPYATALARQDQHGVQRHGNPTEPAPKPFCFTVPRMRGANRRGSVGPRQLFDEAAPGDHPRLLRRRCLQLQLKRTRET